MKSQKAKKIFLINFCIILQVLGKITFKQFLSSQILLGQENSF